MPPGRPGRALAGRPGRPAAAPTARLPPVRQRAARDLLLAVFLDVEPLARCRVRLRGVPADGPRVRRQRSTLWTASLLLLSRADLVRHRRACRPIAAGSPALTAGRRRRRRARRPRPGPRRGVGLPGPDGAPPRGRRRPPVRLRAPRAASAGCETLEGSRKAVLDVEASELRRIERDLHDGAQQRLVMLTIDLSLAAERIDTDPARPRDARRSRPASRPARRWPSCATWCAASPRRSSSTAAWSRRSSAIAGRCPVPTVVASTLPPGERLPDAVERAAYFVVAEALANVAKHASAARLRGPLPARGARARRRGLGRRRRRRARRSPGGGLAGLAGRVEALDGTLTVDEPAGRTDARPRRDPGPRAGARRPRDGARGATRRLRSRPGARRRAVRSPGRSAPPARGGGRSPSRAARACRRCC